MNKELIEQANEILSKTDFHVFLGEGDGNAYLGDCDGSTWLLGPSVSLSQIVGKVVSEASDQWYALGAREAKREIRKVLGL